MQNGKIHVYNPSRDILYKTYSCTDKIISVHQRPTKRMVARFRVLSGSLDGTEAVGAGRVCRTDDSVERRYAVGGRGLQFKPLYDGHQEQKHLHSRQGLSQANPAP